MSRVESRAPHRLEERRVLLPVVVEEVVERGRPPVRRAPRSHGGENGCRLRREVDAVVVRVPHVLDADRLGLARVRLPLLPVEEAALGDRRRADGDERCEDHCGADQQRLARPRARARPERCEEQERHGKDEDAADRRRGLGHQRDRPRGARKGRCRGEDRAARHDREGREQGEREDGEDDHAVHERAARGVEGERDLVEVGEAASEPVQHWIEKVVVTVERAGVEDRDVEGERGDGHGCHQRGADSQRPARQDRRADRERSGHGELAASDRLLERLPARHDQQRR